MRILLFILLFYSNTLFAQPLRIAVASNFYHTIKLIKAAYQKIYPVKIDLISGSTGKLFAQIQHGAPYDIFLAADVIRPEKLEQSGFTVAATRNTYAIGQLVFYSKTKAVNDINAIIKSMDYQKIAIANPKTAPYGNAAVETLKSLNLYQTIKTKLVFGENIAQTFQFVQSASADYGFVALAQIKALNERNDKKEQGNYAIIPHNLYAPVKQQLVLLKSSNSKKRAMNFLRFMKLDSTKTIIKNQGYTLP